MRLGTDPVFGDAVAWIVSLRIDEPDRRRGRGTVAALAAEEVARGWGCRRIEVTVPAEPGTALALATALGYVVRNRNMEKAVGDTRPPCRTAPRTAHDRGGVRRLADRELGGLRMRVGAARGA